MLCPCFSERTTVTIVEARECALICYTMHFAIHVFMCNYSLNVELRFLSLSPARPVLQCSYYHAPKLIHFDSIWLLRFAWALCIQCFYIVSALNWQLFIWKKVTFCSMPPFIQWNRFDNNTHIRTYTIHRKPPLWIIAKRYSNYVPKLEPFGC